MENRKLMKLYDFRSLKLPEKLLEITVDTERLDKAVAEAAGRFLTIEMTDGGIKEGDFVVVETAPADEGDNGADYRDRAEIVPGHIQVNIGKGFYDFKWEQSLVGKKTGEQVMLPKRGKNQPGTIMQVKRRVYPELTDDIIKQLSIEGINTIPEYRAYLKQEMISEEKMRKSGGVNAWVLKELTKSSVFGDLSEEITAFKEEFKEEVRERAERFQMSYEEMLAKRLPPYIKTPEQIEAFISERAEEAVKQKLMGMELARQEQAVLDQSSYEKMKKQYIEMGAAEEVLKECFTYEIYQKTAYADYLNGRIQEYYEDKYRVVYE